MRFTESLCQPRGFATLFFITLIIKLVFAAVVPMTGDEAYFIEWGKHPDFGFYDHPPMAGWFLTVLLTVSDASWWLRLPTVLITSLIAYSCDCCEPIIKSWLMVWQFCIC